MRIVIVDDMAAMRRTVKRALEFLEFDDFVEAKHGKEAHDRIIANHDIPGKQIELAIVDWNMAPLSGFDLLKMIRSDKRVKDIIFIMLTAEQRRENIVAAMQAGVDEYLVKPFNLDTLKEKLESIVSRRLSGVKQEFDEHFAGEDISGNEKELSEWAAKANDSIMKVWQIAPWSLLPPMTLAKIFIRAKEYDKAEKRLREVISKNFGLTEAHELLSQALRSMGKMPESIKELEIALRERPKSGEIREKLGEAYLRNGRIDKAIELLNESVKVLEQSSDNKLSARGRNALGEAKMEKSSRNNDEDLANEAAEDIEKAVTLDPEYISAYYNLMVAYKKAGMPDKALKVFEKVQSMEPKDSDGWLAIGRAFMDKDEIDKSSFAFKKAAGLADGRFAVYFDIAQSLYAGRRFDDVLKYLDGAKKCNPSEKSSYNLSGIVQRILGKHAASVVEYRQAIQIDPEDAAIYFNLGKAYIESGEKAKGTESMQKALDLAPELGPQLKPYLVSQ